MALPGFIFGGDGMPKTPEELARARSIAEALLMPQRPAQNVGEGLAVLGQAIRGRREMNAANRAQAAGDASASSAISQALGSGAFPPAPGGGSAPAAGASNYRDAIAGIESAGSGDYSAVGPTSKTLGRALGRYQVMEANIGPWSKEALGREVTPQEFLANPNIQDAVFDHQFGKYVQQYGNPQDAASAWFTGGPLSTGAKKKDVLGTSGAAYVDKFSRGLGSGGGVAAALAGAPQGQQVASLDPSVGMPPAPSPVAAALQLPQQAPIPQARPDVVAALNGAPPPGAVGGPGATTPAGQRVLGQMMSPLPMGGNAMQMQPPQAAPPAPAPDQSGKPQGPGTPGEIRKGADGKTYQYAQTTGMSGATGDQGWIETSMAAPQGAPAAPADPSLPVMAGGGSDAIAPGQGGPSVQQLMQAAQNPWLKPEQRQLVNSLLAQKMQEQDPLRQLQIKAAQKSLDTPPKQWQKLDDNTLFDPASGEVKEINGGAGEPLFKGNSVEAQSLNGLVASGALTKDQALQLGAGKTVTDPTTGAVLFMTPQGIFAKPTDGSAPQPVGQGAPPAANAAPASAQPPANPGMIPVTGGKVTADERNAMTYADRMAVSGGIIDSMGMKGSGFLDQVGSHAPFGLDNYATSDEFKKVDQAKRDFVNAQLRRESGAAISTGEFDSANKQYFPQPNDPPEVVEQKRKNRELVIEGMKRDAGPTYKPREKPKGAAPTVIDGYTIEEVQ